MSNNAKDLPWSQAVVYRDRDQPGSQAGVIGNHQLQRIRQRQPYPVARDQPGLLKLWLLLKLEKRKRPSYWQKNRSSWPKQLRLWLRNRSRSDFSIKYLDFRSVDRKGDV